MPVEHEERRGEERIQVNNKIANLTPYPIFLSAHCSFSKFVLDCFEGQIISAVVVVVFVAIFLLREWVLQNQDAEDGMDAPARPGEGLVVGPVDVDGLVDRLLAEGIQNPDIREALVRLQVDNNNNHNENGPRLDLPFDQPQRQNPAQPRRHPQDFWRNDGFDFDRNDNDRRLHSLNENPPLPLRGTFPPAGESSSARPGYVYDPLNQTYHP